MNPFMVLICVENSDEYDTIRSCSFSIMNIFCLYLMGTILAFSFLDYIMYSGFDRRQTLLQRVVIGFCLSNWFMQVDKCEAYAARSLAS
jgi:hypothetical protein